MEAPGGYLPGYDRHNEEENEQYIKQGRLRFTAKCKISGFVMLKLVQNAPSLDQLSCPAFLSSFPVSSWSITLIRKAG